MRSPNRISQGFALRISISNSTSIEHFFTFLGTCIHSNQYIAWKLINPNTDLKLRNLLIPLLLGTFVSASAFAEESNFGDIEQRIADTKARLNLSDEQVDAITPILEENVEKQLAVLERYGVDLEQRGSASKKKRMSLRQARSLRNEMNGIRQEALKSMSSILTEDQIDEYREIQEERKAELKKRIRAKR